MEHFLLLYPLTAWSLSWLLGRNDGHSLGKIANELPLLLLFLIFPLLGGNSPWLQAALLAILGALLALQKHKEPMARCSRFFALGLLIGGFLMIFGGSHSPLAIRLITLGSWGVIGLFPFCFTERSLGLRFDEFCRDFWTKTSYGLLLMVSPLIPQDGLLLLPLLLLTLVYNAFILFDESYLLRLGNHLLSLYFFALVLFGEIYPFAMEDLLRQLFLLSCGFAVFALAMPVWENSHRSAMTIFQLKGLGSGFGGKPKLFLLTLFFLCAAPFTPEFLLQWRLFSVATLLKTPWPALLLLSVMLLLIYTLVRFMLQFFLRRSPENQQLLRGDDPSDRRLLRLISAVFFLGSLWEIYWQMNHLF